MTSTGTRRVLVINAGSSSLKYQLVDPTTGVSDATGTPRATVPDLGPAVLMDQLRVMVHDWQGAGLSPQDLGRRLTALRRTLP